MDLSFGRAAFDRAAAGTVRLDYPQLIAILATAQAATATARVESWLSRAGEVASEPVGALVALMDPQPGWTAAAGVLGGSFNPAAAGKAP